MVAVYEADMESRRQMKNRREDQVSLDYIKKVQSRVPAMYKCAGLTFWSSDR